MFANAVIFQEPKPKLLSNQYSSQKVCLRQLVKRVTMLQAVRRKGRRLCIGTSGTTMCETTKEWGEMSKLDMHPTVPFDPFNVHCQCRAWIYHQVLRIGDFTPMRPDPIGALLKQPDAFEEQAAKQAIHWEHGLKETEFLDYSFEGRHIHYTSLSARLEKSWTLQ